MRTGRSSSSIVRGGFWRNFLVKYPESNEMYCRMREVSGRLEAIAIDAGRPAESGDSCSLARTELYRAQCNCPYWHGAFGGLYLPHLRNAIYKHLISADTRGHSARRALGPVGDAAKSPTSISMPARRSSSRATGWRRTSPRPAAVISTSSMSGPRRVNLRRRSTAGRRRITRRCSRVRTGHAAGAVSIHDLVTFKQPDLDKRLSYDAWPRKTLVDHFLRPGLSLDEFQRSQGEIGDFVVGVYESVIRKNDKRDRRGDDSRRSRGRRSR